MTGLFQDMIEYICFKFLCWQPSRGLLLQHSRIVQLYTNRNIYVLYPDKRARKEDDTRYINNWDPRVHREIREASGQDSACLAAAGVRAACAAAARAE